MFALALKGKERMCAMFKIVRKSVTSRGGATIGAVGDIITHLAKVYGKGGQNIYRLHIIHV